jgi:eukaryotic-like serine/threonine-protein kinase
MFDFGEGFELDVSARTLRRNEEVIPLNRRSFDVLLYLVQNPGRVLSRDELLKNVWPDTFVDESSLVQSISVLRRALGEKSGDRNYIITLPGRGYQFTLPVKVSDQDEESNKSLDRLNNLVPAAIASPAAIVIEQQTVQTSIITQEKIPANRLSTRTWLLPLMASVIAVTAAGVYMRSRTTKPAPARVITAPARRSIAVLGFRNLSARPDEAWVSTALSEMLSTELIAGEKLRLVSGEDIARTKLDLPVADADSFSRETLSRLHKNLGSDFVVLGSYTALRGKSDTRLRLDLTLQDTAAGETVADVAVIGNEANLFDMVSQAGARLREKLGVEAVSSVEAVSVRASLPANPEAARLYAEGLARLRVFDALAARDFLQQAIDSDPKFPLAHSALAEAWWRMGYDKKAQSEARQAYEMSANLSREERLLVEGRYREINHEYDKTIEIYRTLFVLFPDNLDYGLKLADIQSRGSKSHDALTTIESLRKLPAPASDDPRIDLQESSAWAALSDYKHQEQPLSRAVEKAKTAGSRLVFAQALVDQCRLFVALERTESAVAACREATGIFAAAGDRRGEAGCLGQTADALKVTDIPEATRLYEQALTLFRKIGSERGAAATLNNLGLIYEAQGDLATAEKMHRQALAGFRLVDEKKAQAAAMGNIADERLEQGDLKGALQLYEESTQTNPEDAGRAANVEYNIASLHQLQGDFASAQQGFEQSLSVWQKNSDQFACAYSMWSLGSILVQEADFPNARKMYEQSLAIRTAAGDKLTIAETQLDIAELSLEEARSPAEQESAIRTIIDIFQQQKARDDETRAWWILTRALLAEGKIAAAKQAVQQARALAAKSQNPEIRWRTAIAAATVETADKVAAGSVAGIAARKELESVIAQSRKLGYRIVELDARLASAELEMQAGQTAGGRTHLSAIEADAKVMGYNLVVRKAATARS